MSAPDIAPSFPYVFGAPAAIGPIFAKMGGRYTIGALRLCDSPAGHLRYRCPATVDPASLDACGSFMSSDADGYISFDLGLEFPVAARPGASWRMFVVSEPDRTFSVWLVEDASGVKKVIGVTRSVPSDNRLCDAVVSLHRSMPRK